MFFRIPAFVVFGAQRFRRVCIFFFATSDWQGVLGDSSSLVSQTILDSCPQGVRRKHGI
jgi:hypothetical protein